MFLLQIQLMCVLLLAHQHAYPADLQDFNRLGRQRIPGNHTMSIAEDNVTIRYGMMVGR